MIHPFLQSYQAPITNLCQRHNVVALYAFGSVTNDTFNEQASDIDLLVELPDGLAPEQKGAVYFLLHDELQRLLNKTVDLLLLPKSFRNPYFAQAVEQSKQLLYAA